MYSRAVAKHMLGLLQMGQHSAELSDRTVSDRLKAAVNVWGKCAADGEFKTLMESIGWGVSSFYLGMVESTER